MPALGSDNDLRMANQGHERRVIQRRIGVALLGMLVMLGILLFRFYSLQVTQHEDFVTRSDRNRIQVQPVAPTRGLIYDRNGILLADNRPSYRLSVIFGRAKSVRYRSL